MGALLGCISEELQGLSCRMGVVLKGTSRYGRVSCGDEMKKRMKKVEALVSTRQ